MNEIDNNDIKTILFDLSKRYILPKFKNLNENDIKRKQNNDLVTSVDIIIEKELNHILCQLLPNSLYVGEEKFSLTPDIIQFYKTEKYCWTVDPIDGTTNFVKGKDKFAIMIALSLGNKIIQSWIYKPLTEEICYASLNGGAYINEKKLKIERNSSLHNSIGSISSKYWDDDYLEIMKNIKYKFSKIISYGCIGFEYIDIANNIRDFAILSKLSPWDHLPGILLLREAGGFDSYFDDNSYNHCFQKKNLVVAGNSQLGNEILNIIRENKS